MENKVQIIKNITKELVSLLKLEAEIMVLEEGDAVKINIMSQDPSLIIGASGQNLYALEHLIRIIANKNKEDFVYINLDISDYKKRRKEMLENMVKKTIDEVKKSKNQFELETMNPSDRKVVHTLCQSVDGITSISEGDGRDRRVIIKFVG